MPLYTYTYYSPEYRQTVTLDCFAASQRLALRSAWRFLVPRAKRLHQLTDGQWKIKLPRTVDDMRLELPPPPPKPA